MSSPLSLQRHRREWQDQFKQSKNTFPWCKPIPAKAKRVKSAAATTLLQGHQCQWIAKGQVFYWKKETKKNHKVSNIMTDLTWRTVAPFLPWQENHLKTPLSEASFHMTPWPPGLLKGLNGLVTNHCPSSAPTTGTRGWKFKNWKFRDPVSKYDCSFCVTY